MTETITAHDSTDELTYDYTQQEDYNDGRYDKRDLYIPDNNFVPPADASRPTLIKNVFTWSPSRIAAYVEQEVQARVERMYPVGSVWTTTKAYSLDKGAADPAGCLGFGEWAYVGMKVLDKDSNEDPVLGDGTETDLYLYFYIRTA